MASGSIAASTNNQYISAQINWSSTSNGSAANSSNVYAELRVWRNNTGFTTTGTGTWTITINGVAHTITESKTFTYNSNTLVVSNTVVVAHDPNGTKAITISVSGGIPGTSYTTTTGSGTATLDTIPRYASLTSAYVSSTGLNSGTFYWAADVNCNYVRAYLNQATTVTLNVSSATASSGTFTYSGLSPGTAYTLYIEVRRADSGLWTKSGAISFTTKAKTTLATISTTSPVIGRDLTYTLSNPSATTSRIQVYVKDSGDGWGSVVYDYNSAPNSGTLSLSGVKATIYDRAINRASTQYLVRVWCGNSAYYNDYTYNVSIPVSTITNPTFTMDSAGTISISRDDANLTHKLTWAFGNASGTIVASGATTSQSWTPATATLAPQVPNATSGVGTITCTTYHGTATVGTSSKSFTANVPASVVPTFTSLTHAEQNTVVPPVISAYVKNVSNIKFTINGAAGVYSSTISAYTITYKGSNKSGQTYTTGTIDWSGDQTVTATITDSRGRTATKSITISALNYSRPVISTYTVRRCTSSGVLDEMGGYVELIRTGSVSSLIATNEKNRITAKAYYKKTADTTWTEILVAGVGVTDSTNLSGALSNTAYIIPNILATDSYKFKLDVSDKFYTTTVERTVSSGTVIMSLSETGVGIGKVWQQGALDVKGDVFVEGNIYATTGLDFLPVGMVMPWFSNTLPSNKWLVGEGQSLAAYPQAASIWGANLPDTRGRVLVGKTASGTFATTGAAVGAETTTGVVAHTHTINHDHGAVTSGSQSANHTHTGTTGNNSVGHTHSIPALSGTAASAGAHTHGIRYKYILGVNIADSSGFIFLRRTDASDSYTGTDDDAANSAGAHTHSVSTTASTSGGISANHTHSMTTGDNSVGHTHSVDLPLFSGTSGSTGSTSISLVQPSLVVRWIFKVMP